jgi:hypothetical protein
VHAKVVADLVQALAAHGGLAFKTFECGVQSTFKHRDAGRSEILQRPCAPSNPGSASSFDACDA